MIVCLLRGIKQIPKICILSFATLTPQQAVGYYTNFQDGIFIITFYVASYGVLNSKCNNEKSESFFDSRKKFFDKINSLPRFEVSLGELQFIAGHYKQKKIDVLMSLDIADKCFEKQITHAVLVAGDSDFISAIRRAKRYGAIVHLFADKNSVNKKMIGEVDEFHFLDEEFLRDCKL